MHGSSCAYHGRFAMIDSPSKKVLKAFRMMLAGVVLLLLLGVCSLAKADDQIIGTYILDAKVTPLPGSANFQLTVDYIWVKCKSGRPANIHCGYICPDGSITEIGIIYPSSDLLGEALSEDGMINDQATLTFNAVMPDGTIQEGQYTAVCATELWFKLETVFTVTSADTTAVPIGTETVVDTAPAPVCKLQVEMVSPGDGYDLTAKWSGDLTINPDGSIRTKVPGSINATVPLKSSNNKRMGSYVINVPFNVDVAGSIGTATVGITMRLSQNYADYQVLPLTVADGKISSANLASCQKAVEEMAPKWLDQILTGLEFENTSLPVTLDVSVGRWKGSATLTLMQ